MHETQSCVTCEEAIFGRCGSTKVLKITTYQSLNQVAKQISRPLLQNASIRKTEGNERKKIHKSDFSTILLIVENQSLVGQTKAVGLLTETTLTCDSVVIF